MTTGVFTDAQIARFSEEGVIYAILARLDFVTGTVRLWEGGMSIDAGGYTWKGVADPDSNRIVMISEVVLPEPGVASAIRIGLTGINQAAIEAAVEDSAEVEGQPAELFICMFDGDEQPIGNPVSLDPASYMTAFSHSAKGMSERSVSITIEGTWSAKDFPPGAQLTDADQQRRHTGDRVCKFVGWQFEPYWGPV